MPDWPSELLVEYLHLANIGKALDIACGTGRNTHYMADKGFEVDAVDISEYALEQIKEDIKIHKIDADLDEYRLQPEAYDLIVKFNFLDRNLFDQIIRALKPGGIFIYETFVKTPVEAGYHNPTNPDFHLDLNEVPQAFKALELIHYEEKDTVNLRDEKVRVASYVGKKPA